ncbi:MAG: hypothetical protein IKN27_08045 [Selenomonadaceae bacterium]|nr:hypothetical protein [Selenomonadaceae bacterium]
MNEIIETPATNYFIAELDAAIQKIKRDPKVRLGYVTFEMCMEERALERQIQLVKKFFAAGTPIKTIIQATGWGKQKVKKILDERPNENLDHESLMEINSDSIASANKNFSGIRAKIYARTYKKSFFNLLPEVEDKAREYAEYCAGTKANVAKRLVAIEFSIADVAECTNLTEEEILELLNEDTSKNLEV